MVVQQFLLYEPDVAWNGLCSIAVWKIKGTECITYVRLAMLCVNEASFFTEN